MLLRGGKSAKVYFFKGTHLLLCGKMKLLSEYLLLESCKLNNINFEGYV